MTDVVKTMDLGNGYIGRISYDQDVECPCDANSDVKLVVLHRRYSDPCKGALGSSPDEVRAWVKRHPGWYVQPLWMYDHSETTYRAGDENPFDCQWDSGQVGIVAVRKQAFGRKDDEIRRSAIRNAIKSTCEEYTDWANGYVFCFEIINEHDEQVDSCGGYFGFDAVESAMLESMKEAA